MKIRAELRLKHEILLHALESRGWTLQELSKQADVSIQSVSLLANLRFHKLVSDVQIQNICRISDCLEIPVEELIPDDVKGKSFWNVFKKTIDVDSNQLEMMQNKLLPSPVDVAIQKETTEQLLTRLDELTTRQRYVIVHRFGLEGETIKTLEEIGSILRVTRERVRAIEAQAMGKLSRTCKGLIDIPPKQITTKPKTEEEAEKIRNCKHYFERVCSYKTSYNWIILWKCVHCYAGMQTEREFDKNDND